LDIFSHSLNAAVKRDFPEPAVPMMNATGIVNILLYGTIELL
jgi:hypothetical protein